MKKILFLLIMIFAMLALPDNISAQTSTAFGKTTAGDYSTLTLFSGAKTDTAWSSVIRVQYPLKTVHLWLHVDTVSTSDSLWVKYYGSGDGTNYKELTTSTFSTVTAAMSGTPVLISITDPPKFIKARYWVMGGSSRFYFTLKATAR
jgi:hypothetical protein